MKKIFLSISVCSIALGLFLYFYTFPVPIQQVHRAVQFNYGDPQSVEHTRVYIDGVLERPIGRDHYFKGSMIWEHLDRTKTYETQIWIRRNEMAVISYFGMNQDGTPSVFFLGRAQVEGEFAQIFVELAPEEEVNTRQTERSFLAAPAGSYEEGMNMIQDDYEVHYSSLKE
ncbi:hypothetical protein [Paenibacillus senegalensis]|uniref:hypothetical protein n=1 Tax=Paenibacillus senegalensis TaxID=1465766 RepID=UPI00028A2B59|nr:hypothetical protein [Paenibacillus senegalensis]